jgi:phage terminase large subunit
MNAPRQVKIMATSAQREVLQRFLFDGPETSTVATGGTRFGGKTWTGANCIGLACLMHSGLRGLALRTVLKASDLNMGEELKQAFFRPMGLPLGSRRRGEIQHLVADHQFHFPNGSLIQLGFCKRPNDWEQHLGLQWDFIWWEQAEQFTEDSYDKLGGSNRPNNTDFSPKVLLTFNPGGIGAPWIKRRVVDPETRDARAIYVPSHIDDCPATLERDPGYIIRSLNKTKDPILRAQWRKGDWDALSGIYFRLLPDDGERLGTIQEVKVPYYAEWYGGVDWGGSKPFAYLVVAQWKDARGKDRIHVVGEVYEGGLDLDIQAERALQLDAQLRKEYPRYEVVMRMADPSTANPIEGESTEQSRSKAEIWAKHGFTTYPSMKYGRTSRWELFKYLMRHRIMTIDPSCVNLIRELRGAVRLPDKEDIDQLRCPDHALDALSYPTCYLFGLEYAVEKPLDARYDLNVLRDIIVQN